MEKHSVFEERTITAIDYFGAMRDKQVKPSWLKVKMQFGFASKIVFCYKNGCWSVERKVKGTVYEKVFTPFPGQNVTYKIHLAE